MISIRQTLGSYISHTVSDSCNNLAIRFIYIYRERERVSSLLPQHCKLKDPVSRLCVNRNAKKKHCELMTEGGLRSKFGYTM